MNNILHRGRCIICNDVSYNQAVQGKRIIHCLARRANTYNLSLGIDGEGSSLRDKVGHKRPNKNEKLREDFISALSIENSEG